MCPHQQTSHQRCRSGVDTAQVICCDPTMKIQRIMPDLTVDDLAAAVREHTAVLGLKVVMDHGWIVILADDQGHQLGLMTADASASVNPDVSVFVDDVHGAHEAAKAAGIEIVHPLAQEPWGSLD